MMFESRHQTSRSKWLPDTLRQSLLRVRNRKSAPTWRARAHDVRLTPSKKLVVTRRAFRTKPENRSAKYVQLVLPVHVLPGRTRELSVRYHRTRRLSMREFYLLPLQRLIPFVLVGFGLGGVIHFGGQMLNTSEPPRVTAASVPVPTDPLSEGSSSETSWHERSEPVSLTAESIDLETEIMSVGLEQDGTMEVPPIDEFITGWYRYSPTPGELGPAVIAGHIDNRSGPSVFWHLAELKTGETVQVEREDGQTVEFEVYRMEEYSQDSFPTDEVYGNTERPELRLITCGGEYDWRAGRYSHNTVVYLALK